MKAHTYRENASRQTAHQWVENARAVIESRIAATMPKEDGASEDLELAGASCDLLFALIRLDELLADIDETCQVGLNSASPDHWQAALGDVLRLVRTARNSEAGA